MTALRLTVRRTDGSAFVVTGRDAWALMQLVQAGPAGCTPLTQPGPRWSGYVYNLRRRHGLDIESVEQRHGGAFAGRHVRYVLHSEIQIVAIGGGLEAA
jgi:hypothetical protein